MRGDEGLGVGQDVVMVARSHQRLDPSLFGAQPELMQAVCLDDPGLPLDEIRERVSFEAAKGLFEYVRGPLRLAQPQELPTPDRQALEAGAVDARLVHDQAIAEVRGLDRARAQRLPKPGHTTLEHLGGGRRRAVPPESGEEAVVGDRKTGA